MGLPLLTMRRAFARPSPGAWRAALRGRRLLRGLRSWGTAALVLLLADAAAGSVLLPAQPPFLPALLPAAAALAVGAAMRSQAVSAQSQGFLGQLLGGAGYVGAERESARLLRAGAIPAPGEEGWEDFAVVLRSLDVLALGIREGHQDPFIAQALREDVLARARAHPGWVSEHHAGLAALHDLWREEDSPPLADLTGHCGFPLAGPASGDIGTRSGNMSVVLRRENEETGGTEEIHLPAEVEMPNGEAMDVDADGFVNGLLKFSLSEMNEGVESMNDTASEELVGSTLLENISYRAEGVDSDGMVQVRVHGNVLALLREEMGWEVHHVPAPSPR